MDMFKIYIDRLTGEREEIIHNISSADFLDIHEAELTFSDPIEIDGKTYLTKQHVILHLKIQTKASLLCKICNKPCGIKIHLKDFYHAEPLENIRGSVYDYTEKLREAIILEVPAFIECNEGFCPQREEIKDFFADKPKSTSNFPFKNLPQE